MLLLVFVLRSRCPSVPYILKPRKSIFSPHQVLRKLARSPIGHAYVMRKRRDLRPVISSRFGHFDSIEPLAPDAQETLLNQQFEAEVRG